MSSYFLFICVLGIGLLALALHYEKNKVGPLWIVFFTWQIPITISQNTNLLLNKEWNNITFYAAVSVIMGFICGYFVSETILLYGRSSRTIKPVNLNKIRFHYFVIMAVTISSIVYLYFGKLGGPPIFSEDVSSARTALLKLNPVLFSLTQLCNIGGSIFGILLIMKRVRKIEALMWCFLLILLLFSAWRNIVLTFLVFSFVPLIFSGRVRLKNIILFGVSFLILFSLIGFLRGDQGDISGFSFKSAYDLILLYMYPNFINFETIQKVQIEDFHLYSLQFILKPLLILFGANVSPPQTSMGAFNVSTGLSPLYLDGGVTYVFIVFVMVGSTMSLLSRLNNYSVVIQFMRSCLVCTLVFLHNGWFLLNFMFSYSLIFYFLVSFGYIIVTYQKKEGRV